MDLVIPGENGHVVPAGDVSALANRISDLIEAPSQIRAEMGKRSAKLIADWSGRNLAIPLVAFLDSIYDARH